MTSVTPREQKTRGNRNLLDAFREVVDTLWTSLAPGGAPSSLQRLLFSCPDAGAGSTTIATCAAAGLAQHLRQRVLLIEANYHRPAMAGYLGIPDSPGLTNLIQGSADPSAVLYESPVPGLQVIPAGSDAPPPEGFFATETWRDLFARLSAGYRFAILDAAPLPAHPESRLLLMSADASVPVFRSARTRVGDSRRWIEAAAGSGRPIRGAILNQYRSQLPPWIEHFLSR